MSSVLPLVLCIRRFQLVSNPSFLPWHQVLLGTMFLPVNLPVCLPYEFYTPLVVRALLCGLVFLEGAYLPNFRPNFVVGWGVRLSQHADPAPDKCVPPSLLLGCKMVPCCRVWS